MKFVLISKLAIKIMQTNDRLPHAVLDLPSRRLKALKIERLLDLSERHQPMRLLEIGTGSGYQAAILSLLCKQVYTIEYVTELADMAKAHFEELGYNNIESMAGNGYDGWPEYAPFDGIIVTAAATHIPEALIEQLKPGGRMVIPVGRKNKYQELTLVEKDEDGELIIRDILGVAFVPFQGEGR